LIDDEEGKNSSSTFVDRSVKRLMITKS